MSAKANGGKRMRIICDAHFRDRLIGYTKDVSFYIALV